MNAKIIVLAVLALSACSMAFTLNQVDRIECQKNAKVAENRIFESQIRAVIEQLRQALISNGLDPLDVSDYQLNINNALLNLTSTWTAQSQGLAGFEITRLSLSMIGLRLRLGVRFPSVTASGRYNVDLSTPIVPHRLFGDGTFDVAANNFHLSADGRLYTKLSHGRMVVQIRRLTVDLSLDSFNLALTGLMNDPELSQEVSERLTNELPSLLVENRDRINQIIAEALPYVNDILAGNTYAIEPVRC